MSPPLEKKAGLRMAPRVYQQLRQRVLERDGWRCQACGSLTNLEVHHIRFRSQQGHDTDENLITLCFECHKRAHNPCCSADRR
jgi:5-methylcytosine-specific restriction endonuclease McrA